MQLQQYRVMSLATGFSFTSYHEPPGRYLQPQNTLCTALMYPDAFEKLLQSALRDRSILLERHGVYQFRGYYNMDCENSIDKRSVCTKHLICVLHAKGSTGGVNQGCDYATGTESSQSRWSRSVRLSSFENREKLIIIQADYQRYTWPYRQRQRRYQPLCPYAEFRGSVARSWPFWRTTMCAWRLKRRT